MLKYKRVLLKLSGEALAGDKKFGLDHNVIGNICTSIINCAKSGAQIAVVIGGGNFWRGRSKDEGMNRVHADHIGMLATVMNSIAVADVMEQFGQPARVCSALTVLQAAEDYYPVRAKSHLEKKRVIFIAGGTSQPFFSTDTAAVIRAAEIEAEIILKATMVDGVYDKDPNKFKDAKKYDALSYSKILENHLGVIDPAAAALAAENNIHMLVFNLSNPDNIFKAINGENVGTIIS